jgi:hypothetical protein
MWHISCLDISLAGLNFARRKKNADVMILIQGTETTDDRQSKQSQWTNN